MHEKEQPYFFQQKLTGFCGSKMRQLIRACFRKVGAVSGKKKGRLWRKAALGGAKPGFAGGSLLCSGKAGESILIGREIDGLEVFDTVFRDIVPNHTVALILQLVHVDIG